MRRARRARFDRGSASGHNEFVLRWWCLAALLVLSVWVAGNQSGASSSDTAVASNSVSSCALDAPLDDASSCGDGASPSGDGASNRHWDVPARTAAYLTPSVWTSQVHHAELAASPCRETRLPLRAGQELPGSTPRAIRPPVPGPLLI
jgi:hypothetical protein